MKISIFIELLRKYPFAPMLTRICVKDYKIPGTDKTILKGETTFFPLYGLHRDEHFYPDPEKFDPTRFTKENLDGINQVNRPYYPFGDGPRNCVGEPFSPSDFFLSFSHFTLNLFCVLHS